MLLKTTVAYQLQNKHYIFVRYFFSQSTNFLSLTHLILFPGYRFAIGIQYNCKEVVDLRFVHPNAAQLSDIFFQKFTDTRLVYKLVGVCSLLSTCSSFSLFLFCLPDMCTCAILRENQNKRKSSISWVPNSQKVNSLIMRNLRHIIFMLH